MIARGQDQDVQTVEGEVAANVTGSDSQVSCCVLRLDHRACGPGRFLQRFSWRPPLEKTDMSHQPGQQEPGPKFELIELRFTLSLPFPERTTLAVLRDLGDITTAWFFSSWSHRLDGSEAPVLVFISQDSWRASPWQPPLGSSPSLRFGPGSVSTSV